MTSMPIRTFLVHNGIDATKDNIAKWRQGWTLSEIQVGKEFIREGYEAEMIAYRSEKNNN